MLSALKKAAIAGAVVLGSIVAADKADAQWGYGPSYGYGPSFGGRSIQFGLNIGGPRYRPSNYSYYGPAYGHSPYGPYGYSNYSHFAPAPNYYGGPAFGRRRGEIKYDVYTPFGKREVEYKFRRDGRVEIDIDD